MRRPETTVDLVFPEPLTVEVTPIAFNFQDSLVTEWELRLYFNTRTQTVTRLTNNELRHVGLAVKEALDNIQDAAFVKSHLDETV